MENRQLVSIVAYILKDQRYGTLAGINQYLSSRKLHFQSLWSLAPVEPGTVHTQN